MLQPPGQRNTQPHIIGTYHHDKYSSSTTPEITFDSHCNTHFRNHTYHTTDNSRNVHQFTILRATSA